MQCGAVRCSAVQCGMVQDGARQGGVEWLLPELCGVVEVDTGKGRYEVICEQYGAVRCGVVLCKAGQAVLFRLVQCGEVRSSVLRCGAVLCGAVQCRVVWRGAE